MRPRPATLFAALASIAAAAGIAAGLMVIGSPSEVRMRRLDEQRVSDLEVISDAIASYRGTHKALPATLDELLRPDVFPRARLKDAASGRPYEYIAKDATHYALCAEFETASDDRIEAGASPFWRHERGRHCFSLEARRPVQR